MGICHGRPIQTLQAQPENPEQPPEPSLSTDGDNSTAQDPLKFPFCSPSPLPSSYKSSPANKSVGNWTPSRLFKRPFPPPSPAKHIKSLLVRRHGSIKPNQASIPEGSEVELSLNKSFGFSNHLFSKYEIGEEIGRGHFGYTCSARVKKGEFKGLDVAVKVIPKTKVFFL